MQRTADCRSSRSQQPTPLHRRNWLPPVSCGYDHMLQLASMRAHAHVMLLCVLLAGVQMKTMSGCVLSRVWTLQANRSASCAQCDSPRAAHIDRTEAAERMSHASVDRTVQLLLPNSRFFARSALMTLSSRRSSGSDESSCTPPSQRHRSRSAAPSKSCICSSAPLQKSCCTSPPQRESAFAPFHRSTSLANRR